MATPEITPEMVEAGAEGDPKFSFFEGHRGAAETMAKEVFEAMSEREIPTISNRPR